MILAAFIWWLPIVMLVCIKKMLDGGSNDPDFWWMFPVAIIIILMLITFLLSWIPNLEIIFDDYGITSKQELNFLFFNILKKTKTLPWSSVSIIDYFGYNRGFAFFSSERDIFLLITWAMTNRKEGFEYAAKKLTKDKFAEDAQEKLGEMGIYI
jgi:hypothetical protein